MIFFFFLASFITLQHPYSKVMAKQPTYAIETTVLPKSLGIKSLGDMTPHG